MILSAEERRKKIRGELAGVRVKPDPALLETLVYITEYPTAITGSFDPQFLELPEEVLVTVMRHHQKYFSVEDADGKLAPQFVAVMNIDADPEGFVRSGNERVLRARFNDARFFWETDQKKKLADRVDDLAHVTFQAKLGSYLRKDRAHDGTGGANWAATRTPCAPPSSRKCDLTTELVKEFTELQGVVGGLYARAQGEPEPVWQAIYDHYKPESMEDSIPRNRTGQMVSLADKLDTLRGCFRVGLIPTGSRDPFALRRAAQGVVRSWWKASIEIPLLDLLGGDQALIAFFEDRVKFYFKDHPRLQVRRSQRRHGGRLEQPGGPGSAAAAHPEPAAYARFRTAGRQLQTHPQYSGAGQIRRRRRRSTRLCSKPAPKRICTRNTRRIAGQPIENVISRLRPKVDLFFDKVLVNAPDARVRQNRLTLLNTLLAEFSTFADFSEIVTNS